MKQVNGLYPIGIALLTVIFVSFLSIFTPSLAQENTSKPLLDALKPALEQAEQSGATIIIVSPESKKPTAVTAPAEPSFSDRVIRLRQAVRGILLQADQFFPRLSEAIGKAEDESVTLWLLKALLLAAGALLVGYLTVRLLDRWGQSQFEKRLKSGPESRGDKLYFALTRAAGMIVVIVLGTAAALAVIYTIASDSGAIRATSELIVISVAVIRVTQIVFMNLFLPDAPEHRVLNLDDDTAIRITRTLNIITVISVVVLNLTAWTGSLGLEPDSQKLIQMFALLLAVVLFSGIAIRRRKEIADAITGGLPAELNSWVVRLIARYWHIIAVLYFIGSFGISVSRLALDQPNATGLFLRPILILVAALTIYAVALLVIDKFTEKRIQKMVDTAKAEREAIPAASGDGDGEGEVEPTEVQPRPNWIYKPLVEQAAKLIITTGALVFMAGLWGVDIWSGEGVFLKVLNIGFVIFLSYIVYRVVELSFESKQLETEDQAPGAEAGGGGASRYATFMPIFRNFLLITIVAIGTMSVLSGMGVDIAPLFAGAGVVGLAVGFGSQALVRDVFSGAFFLMDDAFRLGEYVDVGSAKGTVEKISVRSFQLRHHYGPLNSVPFGEIKQVTNYSRDWVMMKLKLRVTYDTDIERVRKLIKNLGQELLKDPDLGPKFLQPLKSQGVVEMQDSAMIIRVKFMTKPGDQFTIRPKIYAKIRELFLREGIHFAHSEVTVRVTSDDDRPPTEIENLAASAAGKAVLAKKEREQSAAPSDDR